MNKLIQNIKKYLTLRSWRKQRNKRTYSFQVYSSSDDFRKKLYTDKRLRLNGLKH